MEVFGTNNILRWLEICTFSNDQEEIKKALAHVDSALNSIEKTLDRDDDVANSLGQIFGILSTIVVEFPPYRLETAVDPATKIPPNQLLIAQFQKRKIWAADILLKLFKNPSLAFLGANLETLDRIIRSNLEPRRFMPFRVIQIGKLAETLYEFSLYFDRMNGTNLLRQMHQFKYPRFGTSGWRARWRIDCNEQTAKCVAQAICDFIIGNRVPYFVADVNPGASNRKDKILLIGYDSRAHARRVAEWVADVARLNDIKVEFTSRDTPTPALVYWATEVIGEIGMAGIVNCTASHNPPEWQGIKFSPFNGVPASTAITDFIAARANHLKIEGKYFQSTPRGFVKNQVNVQKFDPLNSYCKWILSPQRKGIPLNAAMIRDYFKGKLVVIDEMHGASRGYLRKILKQLNVRYTVIHGEKSQRSLKKLAYASPEWPYIFPLAQAVKKSAANLGVGLDTDGDRFGIINGRGSYVAPNKILPLLIQFLTLQGFRGKIVRTVSGSRLIDRIAADNSVLPEYRPKPDVIPSYINHAFYLIVKGNDQMFRGLFVYLEPVGIKYVIEGMLIDQDYRVSYRPNFRDTMLLGGEESSGLTSKGHLPDKDGIWGNLLVMNMIATEQKPLEVLWSRLCTLYGTTFFERLDVDAADSAKERLVSYFFKQRNLSEFAGMNVSFIGGVEYDVVEIQLNDRDSKTDIYLEIRASGTEPLNRIYVEAISNSYSSQEDVKSLVHKVQREVLSLLESFSIDELQAVKTPQQLASILAVTSPASSKIRRTVEGIFSSDNMKARTVKGLKQIIDYIEERNRGTCKKWIALYS